MDVYFVRHGHPNYKDDRLTELGHMQAEAVADRLQGLNIQAVYASTCGRAYETAEHTAKKLGLGVQKCEFMREISCRPLHEHARFQKGTVWDWLPEMIANGESITTVNWQQNPVYKGLNKKILPMEYKKAVPPCRSYTEVPLFVCFPEFSVFPAYIAKRIAKRKVAASAIG